MAKKMPRPKTVFPLYLDDKERKILGAISVRDGVSRAEVARRAIRGLDDKSPPSDATPPTMDNVIDAVS